MSTINAKREAALNAYKNGNADVKKALEGIFGYALKYDANEDLTKKVKTFEDACALKGVAPGSVTSSNDTKDEAAYKKLKVIAEVLNGGWCPNWQDGSEYKYYPYFNDYKPGSGFSYLDCFYAFAGTDVGSRLCFRTKELAIYAGKQFTDIYNEFLS